MLLCVKWLKNSDICDISALRNLKKNLAFFSLFIHRVLMCWGVCSRNNPVSKSGLVSDGKMEPHSNSWGPAGDHCQVLFLWNPLCDFREWELSSPLDHHWGELGKGPMWWEMCKDESIFWLPLRHKVQILEHLLKKKYVKLLCNSPFLSQQNREDYNNKATIASALGW